MFTSHITKLIITKALLTLLLMSFASQSSATMNTLESAGIKYGDDFVLTFIFDDSITMNDYNPGIMSREGKMIVINATSAIRNVALNMLLIRSDKTPFDFKWEKPQYIDNLLFYYDTSTGEFSVKKIHMLLSGMPQSAISSSFVEITSKDMVIGYVLDSQKSSTNLITKRLMLSEFNTLDEAFARNAQDAPDYRMMVTINYREEKGNVPKSPDRILRLGYEAIISSLYTR